MSRERVRQIEVDGLRKVLANSGMREAIDALMEEEGMKIAHLVEEGDEKCSRCGLPLESIEVGKSHTRTDEKSTYDEIPSDKYPGLIPCEIIDGGSYANREDGEEDDG
jgi:hypothetical protein